MGASAYRFTEVSLEEHWKQIATNDPKVIMYSTLKNSGVGSNMDVDWHGWMVCHDGHGFYARVYVFTRRAFFPAPHLAVTNDAQREIEVRYFSEVEGPYCFTMPQDMFEALCDMPHPNWMTEADKKGCFYWRNLHRKHAKN